MKKEDYLALVNGRISQPDAIYLIEQYLLDNKIEQSKIDIFFQIIGGNIFAGNLLESCLKYAINYFNSKYDITIVTKDNNPIFYY